MKQRKQKKRQKQRQRQPHQAKRKQKTKTKKSLASYMKEERSKKEEQERIREVSKKIKKCIRDKKRTAREEKSKYLGIFKGTKNISNVKSAKDRVLTPKIKNTEGETITTRKGIANVFAEFYAKLYEDDEGEENKKEKKLRRSLKTRKRCLKNSNHAIDHLKEGKQETAAGSELNRSKIAVTRRRKR